jgi:hypothetical protein
MKLTSAVALKLMLLLIWAAWFTIVFATNAFDGLKALEMLPPEWAFVSGNYRFVTETTARYGVPSWLNALLFLGVVAWEATAAMLFWCAVWRVRFPQTRGRSPARLAFAVSLGLWGAFLLADEIFIAYAVEGAHMRIFTAQLVTLLVVELLPERPPDQGGIGSDLPATPRALAPLGHAFPRSSASFADEISHLPKNLFPFPSGAALMYGGSILQGRSNQARL